MLARSSPTRTPAARSELITLHGTLPAAWTSAVGPADLFEGAEAAAPGVPSSRWSSAPGQLRRPRNGTLLELKDHAGTQYARHHHDRAGFRDSGGLMLGRGRDRRSEREWRWRKLGSCDSREPGCLGIWDRGVERLAQALVMGWTK